MSKDYDKLSFKYARQFEKTALQNAARLKNADRPLISQFVPAITGAAVGVNAAQFVSSDPFWTLVAAFAGAVGSEQYFETHAPTQWTGANGLVSYSVMTGNGLVHHDPVLTLAALLFVASAANRVQNGIQKPVSSVLSATEEKKFDSALEHTLYKAARPAQYPIEFMLATVLVGTILLGGEGVNGLIEEWNKHDGLKFDRETWRHLSATAMLPITYQFAKPLRDHPSIIGKEDAEELKKTLANVNEDKVVEYTNELFDGVRKTVDKEKRTTFKRKCAENPMLASSLWGAAGALMLGCLGQYAASLSAIGNCYVAATIKPEETGRC